MSLNEQIKGEDQVATDAAIANANAADPEVSGDDNPENVPTNAWITMGLFAAFVIAFGTCASNFMFN